MPRSDGSFGSIMQATTFKFPRTSDAVLIAKCRRALKDFPETKSGSVNFRTQQQAESIKGPELTATPRLEEILKLDADAIHSVTLQLQSAFTITITREDASQHLDTCRIDGFERNDAAIEVLVLKVFSALRRELSGFDANRGLMHVLGEEVKQFADSREEALSRLEATNLRITEDMQAFQRTQQAEFDAHRVKLDEETSAHRKQLDDEHATKLQTLAEKEAALEKLHKEVDDRQSRHARRELRKELKGQLANYSKNFEVTEGTKELGKSVRWTCITLMSIFGIAAFGHLIYGIMVWKEAKDASNVAFLVVLTVKQIVLTGAFVGIATFFIRWSNDWFQKHAREEFRLKRFGLDIDRASWVVEMAMEWRDVGKGEELSSEMLDRLTRNLFAEDQPQQEESTAADKLASALFGASAAATLNVPGGSVTLDRKGIGKLEKEQKG